MEKIRRISMFERMYFAISDFRIYPFIQREKLSTAIGYFIQFSMLMALIISLYSFFIMNGLTEQLFLDYESKIPEFTLEKGVLIADKAEYTVNNFIAIFNTDFSSKNLEEITRKKIIGYNTYALIGNDNIDIYMNEQLVIRFPFSAIQSSFTKGTFYVNVLKQIDNISFKITLFVTTFIAMFLSYLYLEIMNVLVAVITAFILNVLFRIRLKFRDFFKIVIYALTLPSIMKVFAIVFVGGVSESTVLLYNILSTIYIFGAFRIIKLDQILMAAAKSGAFGNVIKVDEQYFEQTNNENKAADEQNNEKQENNTENIEKEDTNKEDTNKEDTNKEDINKED